MASDAERIARLKTFRWTEGERKLAQVQSALAELERVGVAFSTAELARGAKVSRRFVYDHPELLAEAD